jgi:hypothetical protein
MLVISNNIMPTSIIQSLPIPHKLMLLHNMYFKQLAYLSDIFVSFNLRLDGKAGHWFIIWNVNWPGVSYLMVWNRVMFFSLFSSFNHFFWRIFLMQYWIVLGSLLERYPSWAVQVMNWKLQASHLHKKSWVFMYNLASFNLVTAVYSW